MRYKMISNHMITTNLSNWCHTRSSIPLKWATREIIKLGATHWPRTRKKLWISFLKLCK